MEDVVTSKVNYSALDQNASNISIRLNSTVVHALNSADNKMVDVTYVRNGKPHTVRASKCVMACYNSSIPYLCPEMPDTQKHGLAYNVKVPLVYTKVLINNWQPFAKLGVDFVYFTGGFFKQAELAYPVSIGDYKRSQTPDEPMVLHMCHVPWVPEIQGPDQWREGRRRILQTSFEEFEDHVEIQLTQALGSAGFDAERDIEAITVNRWPHGYSYSTKLTWEPEWQEEEQKPWIIGRKPFGNIFIANSDSAVSADTDAAISQAYRAVSEMSKS
jgi:spermidine dehydrogenase